MQFSGEGLQWISPPGRSLAYGSPFPVHRVREFVRRLGLTASRYCKQPLKTASPEDFGRNGGLGINTVSAQLFCADYQGLFYERPTMAVGAGALGF